MSSLTRFTRFSNVLSTYIKNGKNTYGAKLGDQQQVELRREKKYLSHE